MRVDANFGWADIEVFRGGGGKLYLEIRYYSTEPGGEDSMIDLVLTNDDKDELIKLICI